VIYAATYFAFFVHDLNPKLHPLAHYKYYSSVAISGTKGTRLVTPDPCPTTIGAKIAGCLFYLAQTLNLC
jgi:hypothetical protein